MNAADRSLEILDEDGGAGGREGEKGDEAGGREATREREEMRTEERKGEDW